MKWQAQDGIKPIFGSGYGVGSVTQFMTYANLSETTNEDGSITRVSKTTARKNPVPAWVGKQLGMKSAEFSFVTTETAACVVRQMFRRPFPRTVIIGVLA